MPRPQKTHDRRKKKKNELKNVFHSQGVALCVLLCLVCALFFITHLSLRPRLALSLSLSLSLFGSDVGDVVSFLLTTQTNQHWLRSKPSNHISRQIRHQQSQIIIVPSHVLNTDAKSTHRQSSTSTGLTVVHPPTILNASWWFCGITCENAWPLLCIAHEGWTW